MTPALLVPPVYFHRPSLIGSTYDLYERSMLWAARFERRIRLSKKAPKKQARYAGWHATGV